LKIKPHNVHSIAQLGEFALIDHLTKNFEINQASTLKGGDDAAVLDFKDKKVVISTDIVEGSILIWPTCL
jgi:thiamine-monophosphate kinase